MLSTQMRLELTDILCRMITKDGVEVSLEERVWMNKLIEHNKSAKGIHDAMLKQLIRIHSLMKNCNVYECAYKMHHVHMT